MHTSELFSNFRIKQIIGHLPDQINSIYSDSRDVKPNSMFICTRGFTVDGHDFYQDAIDNGATVIVAEKYLDININKTALVIVSDTHKAVAQISNKFYNYPSSQLNMIGVTGTNGKTTVSTIIYSVLRQLGERSSLSGTIGFELDGEKIPSDNTTCDILTNQKLLKQTVNQQIGSMVMEVSSHGLCQGRVWGIDFDVVTFTNLSQDHLDYHKTMDEYGYVKGLLFAQLGQDLQKAKYVVLNEDDPWFKTYNYWSPFEVISYGLHSEADFQARNIQYYRDKTVFTLHSPEGIFEVESRLLGEFNVYNCLAAIASLFAKGNDVKDVVEILKDIPSINGRMEKIDLELPVDLYLDYAHTSDAIEKSIHSVLPFKKNRIIFLVGTGGDRDPFKRPMMAEKASIADYVILTINDPRFEDPETIVKDMEKGMQHNNYALIEDRREAIAHAIEISEPDDIIIFAGKGQEDYQIIENKKHPHSDIDIIQKEARKKYGEIT